MHFQTLRASFLAVHSNTQNDKKEYKMIKWHLETALSDLKKSPYEGQNVYFLTHFCAKKPLNAQNDKIFLQYDK